ncbi:MAG TPA: LytTR family DNA-binding domain-containing protein [Gemmatimonadales bacterium]|nr:LytTR family DNA-binding domain-containing protein [Gemmatimonadales bacterium]
MNDGLRVLIVDDERPARQKLRRILGGEPGVEAVFEAPDGLRAVELIRSEDPDVVFLDIEMPGVDGFQVVEALGAESRPHIVFVTAYDRYAVRAFEAYAVDYILKPYDADRLRTALTRARERRNGPTRVDEMVVAVRRERPEPLERLLVEEGGRAILLPVGSVDRFESDRNYVVVHAGTGRYRLRATLDGLEERLDLRKFARISRSAIVNLEGIVELRPWGHGDYVVELKGGVELRLSRRYRDRLKHFVP